MNSKQQKLAIGCLLHDFGKLLFRYNDGRNHSTSGYEFLKDTEGLRDEKEILNCVRYHHAGMIGKAGLNSDDISYIAYIADNIASAADRRAKDDNGDGTSGFIREAPLESIFNILNGNHEKAIYKPVVSEITQGINYPTIEQATYSEDFYSRVVKNIKDCLGQIYFGDEYINSLLQVLESNLSFVPSSTNMDELRDISLFDHLKLTAAFALCIERYLEEKVVRDYRKELFDGAKDFYGMPAFRIYSLDLSGIQSFIYNIGSRGALKGLRSRSFYLELLMETVVDELLKRTELCRTNVLYTGGGHTYILLPATQETQTVIKDFEKELNGWFLANFGTDLFAAGGYADCSALDLQNKPEGSYKRIFKEIRKNISERKLNRYSASEISLLNSNGKEKHTRECPICHRTDKLEGDKCQLCSSLEKLSEMIIGPQDSFYVITKSKVVPDSVIMPFGCFFAACKKDEITALMKQEDYVRAYTKNIPYTGKEIASNLWIGDYASEKTFHDLASKSTGIKRLGVIRADVDNLGKAFVSGFSGPYETITRTAVFSRKLSMFFKYHINGILKNGKYDPYDHSGGKKPRNATIVYAGGDDLFIVGAWDSILWFAIDLYKALKQYSQGKMTLSAGIGVYGEKYPISAMARESGRLEEISKEYDNGAKNAVTLFGADPSSENKFDNTYHWDELIDEVIGEKLLAIKEYFKKHESGKDESHNNSMLYKMLQLIRSRREENKLNIARFTYLIARLKPDMSSGNTDEAAKQMELDRYNEFAKKMYRWIRDEKSCRQLETAITLYVYLNREKEETENEQAT